MGTRVPQQIRAASFNTGSPRGAVKHGQVEGAALAGGRRRRERHNGGRPVKGRAQKRPEVAAAERVRARSAKTARDVQYTRRKKCLRWSRRLHRRARGKGAAAGHSSACAGATKKERPPPLLSWAAHTSKGVGRPAVASPITQASSPGDDADYCLPHKRRRHQQRAGDAHQGVGERAVWQRHTSLKCRHPVMMPTIASRTNGDDISSVLVMPTRA
ncbi:MAG: hypothetical protein J3K34DRAFT_78879 [Monoraphidium minutum]|nr:MAG: hypothetical protein J3K34DRAFT_78879 [Monoraphidium minutum]